eukprot:TRINITY_DN9746_c0_g1_i1.p1 TRINITY_DN9746_c0_g1~~TRINITY_DN9746_c0_g1_i1.p1  ORF type:complete len:412 (+),score=48.16 TRINITY_DN9746_c0_g1_i1:282-1517(+)
MATCVLFRSSVNLRIVVTAAPCVSAAHTFKSATRVAGSSRSFWRVSGPGESRVTRAITSSNPRMDKANFSPITDKSASPLSSHAPSSAAKGIGAAAIGTAKTANAVLPADTPVVSVEWLRDNLDAVKVVDASWYMPVEKRQPLVEFQALRIPGAVFFDIDTIADTSVDLPHMLPTADKFAAAVSALKISADDNVVIYDGKGLFSAPRAWWMFRVFGHDRVRVLEGGLPKWRSAGLPTDTVPADNAMKLVEAAAAIMKQDSVAPPTASDTTRFAARLQDNLVWTAEQVRKNLETRQAQVVDARSKGRFDGVDPEPRKGVLSGHIPSANNVPFPNVLTPEGTLRSEAELTTAFQNAGLDLDGAVVASCGTGVTACILALALYKVGKKDVPVYDGSWTEWAMLPDPLIATNKTA